MSTQKKGLSIKDLVTTGIFAALCFILVLIGGVFFGANPVLTFWMPVGSALYTGAHKKVIRKLRLWHLSDGIGKRDNGYSV